MADVNLEINKLKAEKREIERQLRALESQSQDIVENHLKVVKVRSEYNICIRSSNKYKVRWNSVTTGMSMPDVIKTLDKLIEEAQIIKTRCVERMAEDGKNKL